ncbi:transporter substrate-binding domain-containing protein [Phreatobacter sp.]|uniref:transporter substrate-binding domain-containing protein n=1 Tax=Phreatobacter sp. TaxID=1966341 RepID=UPI003F706B5D
MLTRLFLSAALCLTAGVAAAQELPAALRQRGTIIAAVVPNYPPLEMKNPQTNELTGFDIELGNAIAAKLGVRMQWQETSFEQMLAAVRTGRIDAAMQGSETLPYIMGLEPNTFALVGEPTRFTLMGIATAKEAEDLRQAIVRALKELMADGTYRQLLAKWQLQPSELTEVTINAGR